MSSQAMNDEPRGIGRPRGSGGGGGGGRGGSGGGRDDKGKEGGKRFFFRRRKVCKFCADKIDYVDYKDVKLISQFVPERGKILPRRMFGTCAEHQRKLTEAINRARAHRAASRTPRTDDAPRRTRGVMAVRGPVRPEPEPGSSRAWAASSGRVSPRRCCSARIGFLPPLWPRSRSSPRCRSRSSGCRAAPRSAWLAAALARRARGRG